MTNTPGHGDLVRRGFAVLRAALPVAVGLTLATAGLAATSATAAGAPPLVGAKRARFVVGWLAVGLVSLAAWRQADGRAAADSRTGGRELADSRRGGTDGDRQRRTERGRTDGGRARRFDRSAVRWQVLVAGLTALGISILLEIGFGVGG